MFRRIAPLAATIALAVTVPAAAAHADDELGVSLDGVTWAHEITAPLFDPSFRFVPGDSETTTFLVRNEGPSQGVLSVEVAAQDPDGLLADDQFLVEARVDGGAWTPVEPGATTVAPAELPVPVGSSVPVDLRATFDPASTRMDEVIPVQVRVVLSEDGSVGGVDEDDGGDGQVGGVDEGALPDTGSPFGAGLLLLAAALLGSGVALVRRRPVRREVVARG